MPCSFLSQKKDPKCSDDPGLDLCHFKVLIFLVDIPTSLCYKIEGTKEELYKMSDSTFGFIGLGLIGGSIARGLRRANKDITIMAYMRTRSKLEQAKSGGDDRYHP